jgi:hypothetical protein
VGVAVAVGRIVGVGLGLGWNGGTVWVLVAVGSGVAVLVGFVVGSPEPVAVGAGVIGDPVPVEVGPTVGVNVGWLEVGVGVPPEGVAITVIVGCTGSPVVRYGVPDLGGATSAPAATQAAAATQTPAFAIAYPPHAVASGASLVSLPVRFPQVSTSANALRRGSLLPGPPRTLVRQMYRTAVPSTIAGQVPAIDLRKIIHR